MNRILIVGHPQSGYEEVEQLLHDCGMGYAQPSRREGFLPAQISETLSKVHKVAPLQHPGQSQIEQISAGPVWNGMALDLMLGNIDQPLWGWADPNAIHWLNYWRDLDPALHFILVFDRPHSVLTRDVMAGDAPLDSHALAERTRHWLTYNSALLQFFHRNPQRCLLVHSEQVRASANTYLGQLRARIDAPWTELLEHPASGATEFASPSSGSAMAVVSRGDAPDNSDTDQPLATFVAEALMHEQPQCLQLYEELQASANLPLASNDATRRAPPLALDAWSALVQQRRHMKDQQQLLSRIEATRQRAEQLALERQNLLDEQHRLHTADAHAHREAIAELTRSREQVEQSQAEMQHENELLLAQLHQVQEELERNYLAGRGQAERIQALETQAAMAEAARDEAARISEKARAEAAAARDGAARFAEQAHAEAAAARNEAARLIEKARAEAAAAKQQAEQAQKELKGALTASQALNRVDPTLAEENDLLLHQLHQVQEELERYYLENRALKSGHTVSKPAPAEAKQPPAPALYGAADRIRQQLTYRVGATLVQRSRTVGGWVGMPWAVMGVVRQHRVDQVSRRAQRLPPIHTYRDAHEAERLKSHLSYRLGSVFLHNARSLGGWLRMPFALRREVRDFRNYRRA